MGQKVDRVRRDLEKRGALEAVRSEIARGKALQFLVDHSTVVDEQGEVIDLSLPTTDELTAGTVDSTSHNTVENQTTDAVDPAPETATEERPEA
jgi:hypothetical protein